MSRRSSVGGFAVSWLKGMSESPPPTSRGRAPARSSLPTGSVSRRVVRERSQSRTERPPHRARGGEADR
eukprot:8238471-Alexandrium_andersonii.AAC.1